jgi:signal transduction histidine kinase
MLSIKIVHIMIIGMIAISAIYTVQSYITFQVNTEQMVDSIAVKNEAIAAILIQRLDLFVNKHIEEFKTLGRSNEIRQILNGSNKQFSLLSDVDEFMAKKAMYENYNRYLPLVTQAVEEKHKEELISVINSFDQEFGYDYANEFFITNSYGANIVMVFGKADYDQSDKEWWHNAKLERTQVGSIQYSERYNRYSIPLVIGIYGEDDTFLGAIHVLIDAEKLTSEFATNAKILANQNKHAVLLDSNGRMVYTDHMVFDQEDYITYNDKMNKRMGHFLLNPNQEKTAISFAKSNEDELNGLGWIVVISEEESSIIESLNGVMNSILLPSLIGIAMIIVIGVTVTIFISNPLRKLAFLSLKLAQGKFDVKADDSKIQEIKTISKSFNESAQSLKKLINTEKELAESKIKIRNERLSAIGELSASMAHDLKNPLAIIKTSSDVLKRKFGNQNEKLDKVLYNMDDAVARMSHQIKDVLDYARATPLEIIGSSLNKIIQNSIESIKIPNNVSIIMPKKDITIECDVRKIEVVFINLILNAVQAIGDKDGKISILTHENDQYVAIQIQNTGDRIPEELLSKIFEPLVTTRYQGTGLGLSTCKNIIKQHGGSISASNDPTTFQIRLPKNIQGNES